MTKYLTDQESRLFESRLKKVRWFVIITLVIIALRFWQLQILDGLIWQKVANENQIRAIDLPPPRGLVRDRKGRVLIGNRNSFNLTVTPADLNEESIRKIASYIGVSPEQIKKLIKEQKSWSPFVPVVIAENLTLEQVAQLEEDLRRLAGVDISAVPARTYPYGEVACHLLGHMGEVSKEDLKNPEFSYYKIGEMIGKDGIEKQLDKYLRGERGYKFKMVDAFGRERPELLKKLVTLKEKPPKGGSEVWLTIDIELESYAQSLFKDRQGALVVLSVEDGQVLALVSSPGYHPSLFADKLHPEEWKKLLVDSTNPLLNRAIQGIYPPGSVFKLVVATAGLESGLITERTTYHCPGFYSIGTHTFKCWRTKGHSTLALEQAIVQSCDVYFYQLGRFIGMETIAKYANLYGLGMKTGIELPGEKAGFIPTPQRQELFLKQKWQLGQTINCAIGQGEIQVTPLQMAQLCAVIANRGKLFQPQYVLKITDQNGNPRMNFEPKLLARLEFRKETFDFLQRAMAGVVASPAGTAHFSVYNPKIAIAGKTGTAQVVQLKKFADRAKDSIPYRFRDHSWFIAFAPVDKPEIAIAVIVEHSGHGSSVAGPIARQVIEKYFELKNAELTKAPPSTIDAVH